MAGITAFAGLPGSGKSYTALELAILPALQDGRKVVTNMPLHIEVLKQAGYDVSLIVKIEDIKTFSFAINDLIGGAVYVLDEIWKIWRTKEFLEAHLPFIKEHRHIDDEQGRSIEIFLVTQSLSDIQLAIREMVETTVITTKLLEAGLDTRFKRDYYRGCVKGVDGLRANFIKSDDLQAYDPAIYRFYKSHANSKSSTGSYDESRLVKSSYFSGWRFKALLFTILALFIVIFFQVRSLSESPTFSKKTQDSTLSAKYISAASNPVSVVPSKTVSVKTVSAKSVLPLPPAPEKKFLDRLLEKTYPRLLGIIQAKDKPVDGFVAFYDKSDGSMQEKFRISVLRGFGVAVLLKQYGVELVTDFGNYEVPYNSNITHLPVSFGGISRNSLSTVTTP